MPLETPTFDFLSHQIAFVCNWSGWLQKQGYEPTFCFDGILPPFLCDAEEDVYYHPELKIFAVYVPCSNRDLSDSCLYFNIPTVAELQGVMRAIAMRQEEIRAKSPRTQPDDPFEIGRPTYPQSAKRIRFLWVLLHHKHQEANEICPELPRQPIIDSSYCLLPRRYIEGVIEFYFLLSEDYEANLLPNWREQGWGLALQERDGQAIRFIEILLGVWLEEGCREFFFCLDC